MICEPIILPGGIRAIVCGRGKRRAKFCRCGARSTKLCDFVDAARRGRTCDKPLCDACAVAVGPNVDHCPDHPQRVGAQLKLEL